MRNHLQLVGGNIMKTRNFLAIAIALFLVVGSAAANAQMGKTNRGGEGNQGRGVGLKSGLVEELNLTSDQIKQMQESKLSMQKALIPLQSEVKLARLELQELLRKGANKSTLDQKIDEISTIKAKIQKLHMAQRVEFRDMLTAEQKSKLEAMPLHMGKNGRGGGRGGHGHGTGFRGDCPQPGGGPFFGDCPRVGDDGI